MEDKRPLKVGDQTLQEFCSAYVSTALDVVRCKGGKVPFAIFEEDLRSRLASSCGIDEEVIRYLHHPFHWEFFLYGNGFSPLKYSYDSKPAVEHRSYVEFSRDVNRDDVKGIVNLILEKYSHYMAARTRNIQNGDYHINN